MLFYNGVYLNYWEVSRVKSFLNDEGEYYTRTGSALNYGLKENAKNLISDAKYYLGDVSINSNNEYGTADALYLFERSNYILNYENFCSGRSWYAPCRAENYCEDNPTDYFCTISKYWVGKVGLMYPSDEYLVYANGVDAACYNDPTKCFIDSHGTAEDHGIPENGWIYNSNNLEGQNSITGNWFITATYNNINYVSAVHPQGDLYMEDAVNDEVDNGVRPVLYLSSNVKITDGTGEQNNPYKHGL